MLCKIIVRLMLLFIRTSCAHTPKHNGVVEHKNNHVLDVARTLMIHMHVPKYSSGDAILTANRIPSSILSRKTSFSVLHKR